MQSTTTDLAARELCLTFLHLARADREKLDRHDRRYAPLARQYGLTTSEIAVALGTTEAHVASLLAETE